MTMSVTANQTFEKGYKTVKRHAKLKKSMSPRTAKNNTCCICGLNIDPTRLRYLKLYSNGKLTRVGLSVIKALGLENKNPVRLSRNVVCGTCNSKCESINIRRKSLVDLLKKTRLRYIQTHGSQYVKRFVLQLAPLEIDRRRGSVKYGGYKHEEKIVNDALSTAVARRDSGTQTDIVNDQLQQPKNEQGTDSTDTMRGYNSKNPNVQVSKYLEEEFEMHSTEVKEQDFVQEMDYGHVRMKEEDSIQHACSTNSLANVPPPVPVMVHVIAPLASEHSLVANMEDDDRSLGTTDIYDMDVKMEQDSEYSSSADLKVDETEAEQSDSDDRPTDSGAHFSSKSPRTHRVTRWGVKIFKEWLLHNHLSSNFETFKPPVLASYLRRFYGEVRTRDGEIYSKESLLSIRSSIFRFLTQPPNNRYYNIVRDNVFKLANNVLFGQCQLMKGSAKEGMPHPPIERLDVKKMYGSKCLSSLNPCALQRKVFFELILHFGRRGRGALRSLQRSDILILKDEQGKEYATLENYQGASAKELKHFKLMYATGTDTCPVASLKLYLSKLNKKCEALFQRPLLISPESAQSWYRCCPLGVNTLSRMMLTISEECGLSKRYTNHSIRATNVGTLLDVQHESVT